MATKAGRKGYRRFVSAVLRLLEPQFIYVTISHNDDGIDGFDNGPLLPPNLLVLSLGGKGHIPLLLWSGWPTNVTFPPIADTYKYNAVFMGRQHHHWCRPIVARMITEQLGERAFVGSSMNRTEIYAQSKFILAPRGWGRNSYRLQEVLQMGIGPSGRLGRLSVGSVL